jgi:hypothetical protein
VHPIERLRYVARSSGADQQDLVRETAHALVAFSHDPAGMVAACRRIVDRHPTSGPLWWLCSRVLAGGDPATQAWEAVTALEGDGTARELAHALPDGATVTVLGWPELTGDALVRRGDVEVLAVDVLGEAAGLVHRLRQADVDAEEVPSSGLGAAVLGSDLLLLEAVAMGPGGALAISGSLAAASTARHAGIPVWLVAGTGRVLPAALWDQVVARLAARPGEAWEHDEEAVPLALVDQACGPGGLGPAHEMAAHSDAPVAPALLRRGSSPGTH